MHEISAIPIRKGFGVTVRSRTFMSRSELLKLITIIIIIHFNDSNSQKYGKTKLFKNDYWKKEPLPINSTIFIDLRVSAKFGISDGKLYITNFCL